MKLEKRNDIHIIAILILIYLTAGGCTRISESGPDDIVKKYLAASLKGRYEEAYNYVSAEDKKVKDLSAYLQEMRKSIHMPAVAADGKIVFKITRLDKKNVTATADVEVTIPDIGYASTASQPPYRPSLRAEGEEEQADEAAGKGAGAYVPMKTSLATFHLVKQNKEWKVFLDWESEKAEREKQAKIDSLLAEAVKLKDTKKLTGALEKYEEVLAIDPALTVARADVETTKEEIKIVEEKKAYVPNIALYNLKGKYYDSSQGVKIPGVTFKLKNKGNKTLKEVEVTVYFKDNSGTVISEETFHPILVEKDALRGDNKLLKPNYIWQSEIGKFLKAPSVPTEWKEGSVSAEITNIEFKE